LEVERLRAFLRRHGRVALDTSVFIYQLEAYPKYLPLTVEVFSWLMRPTSSGITSTITIAELLVQPYRQADEKRVGEFYGLLTTYPNLEWVAPTLPIADLAAKIRAKHRLRTPDAIQAGTAVALGVSGFIGNDSVFERVTEFETLLLDRLL